MMVPTANTVMPATGAPPANSTKPMIASSSGAAIGMNAITAVITPRLTADGTPHAHSSRASSIASAKPTMTIPLTAARIASGNWNT